MYKTIQEKEKEKKNIKEVYINFNVENGLTFKEDLDFLFFFFYY